MSLIDSLELKSHHIIDNVKHTIKQYVDTICTPESEEPSSTDSTICRCDLVNTDNISATMKYHHGECICLACGYYINTKEGKHLIVIDELAHFTGDGIDNIVNSARSGSKNGKEYFETELSFMAGMQENNIDKIVKIVLERMSSSSISMSDVTLQDVLQDYRISKRHRKKSMCTRFITMSQPGMVILFQIICPNF